MRLLVDMDAVIAHWGGEFDRCLNIYGEKAAGIPRSADQPQWDLKAGRTDPEKQIIDRIMREPGFYSRLEPIEGAKEALKAAVAAGHDVRIVSSPFISNPTCASDKLNWLVRHYGSHWGSRLVLTNDKGIVLGDLLVDDKPQIKSVAAPGWKHVVFGDYAYNRSIDDRPRLISWSDPEVALAFLEGLAT